MFIPEILETEDKSYYADGLVKMTGKLRSYWGGYTLEEIKQIYRETLKRVLTIQARKRGNYENAHYQKAG
jgi:hypothetical protein